MTKIIITKTENIRRVEEVNYVIKVPQNIKYVDRYVKKLINDNDYSFAKIISQKILDSELLDEDISKVEIYYSKNDNKVFH